MAEGEAIRGQVKWFDPGKGFGFVVADEGGPDILLHANVLRNFGQSTVVDGASVLIAVERTDRGAQATEVFEISPVLGGAVPALDGAPQAEAANGQGVALLPARVKWFDKVKGFGFANIFGHPEDVFIHMEILRNCGMPELVPGEAICLRVVDGPRGRMAAEVRHWEFEQRTDTP